jgi:hypothetical protein
MADRIMMKNPNTGRDDTTIAVAVYEPTRDAILAVLEEEGELPNAQLLDEVVRRTPDELWAENSAMWFTAIVKLHLEATGLLQKRGSPQILSLTEAGRAARAAS